MSSVITNKTVKPFIDAHDFYPGFKLEEECFSKAIIKDVDHSSKSSKFRKKSELDEEPYSWPRWKSGAETAYEKFLEQVIDPRSGKYYPQRDKAQGGAAIPKTGVTEYITDITRIRIATGEEFLYTKGIVYGFDSRGNSVNHFITKPQIWTKTNFDYRTEYNDKSKSMEEVLQGPSGNELVYSMPFTKQNLKELYDKRQNDFVNFTIKDEQTGKAFQVKDVTGNLTKSYELFRDQPFDYLFTAEYIPKEIKTELRQEAVAQGIIRGGAGDYNQAPSSATTPKNTYQ